MATEPANDPLLIDAKELKKAANYFRAINNDYRCRMLNLLHIHKELTVKELYTKLRSDQSKASVHLAILREAHLVNARREGKSVYYSVNYSQIEQLHSVAKELEKSKKDRLNNRW
jgi:DNA-binding transcriptional ArsR family regulator